MTNIEDYIPYYPLQNDPNIQNIFASKKEFAELEAQPREVIPKRGSYYMHQKFFARMARAVDRIFNIQKTGTGKSCGFIGAAEMLMLTGGYRRTYLLERGDTTIYEMKRQIICKCTEGVYETEIVKRATGTVQKRNITIEIKKNYSLETYYSFAKLMQTLTDEQIIRDYSDCIFILDEAHNIIGASGEDRPEQEVEVYNSIWRVFHLVKRSKIFVVTATPMINDVNEIAPMMNLLLPLTHQLPTKGWDYKFVTLQQMEPYFRGMVTFVESLDSGAIPVYDGQVISNYVHNIFYVPKNWNPPPIGGEQILPPLEEKLIASQVIVHSVAMGSIQDRVYHQVHGQYRGSAIWTNERQVACFVYPDGSYGGLARKEGKVRYQEDDVDIVDFTGTGAAKYIKIIGEDKYELLTPPDFYSWSENPNRLSFKEWLNNGWNLSNLQKLSGKYADIINIEYNSTGCAFVYLELLNGSGSIIFSLCLEAFGFEKFDESTSVFIPTGEKTASICEEGSRRLKPNFVKKKRFAMLNSNVSSSKQAALLELFNSPENIDGEYIQLVIGTRVARDGLNLSHCLRMYMAMAGWTPSGMIQAIFRVLRATSHDLLIQRIIRQLIGEGRTMEEAVQMAIVNIVIYNMAAIPTGMDVKDIVDLKTYLDAEEKDIYIRRMMRYAKQCAVDCRINYKRNVKEGLIDGSPQCDYDICKYSCVSANEPFNPNSPELDFSTYDILYSDEVIEAAIIELSDVLRKRDSITYPELTKMYVDTHMFREIFIYQAIAKMIDRRLKIENRFGFSCYVNTDGYTLFTQRDLYSSIGNFKDVSIYNKQLMSVSIQPFKSISYDIGLPKQNEYVERISRIQNLNTDQGLIELNIILKEMSFDSKMSLIESAIYQVAYGQTSQIAEAIYRRFINFIFRTTESGEEIKEIAQALGRRPVETISGGLDVYLHIYRSLDTENVNYNRVRNYLNPDNIRVLNLNDKLGWRDALPYEIPVYKNAIVQSQQDKLRPYKQFPNYGFILDDIYHIVDNTIPETDDKRSEKVGRVCSSYPKEELIKFLLSNNIITQDVLNVPVNIPRERLVVELHNLRYLTDINEINKLTTDALIYIYKWFQMKVDYMCSALYTFYVNNNRMYVV